MLKAIYTDRTHGAPGASYKIYNTATRRYIGLIDHYHEGGKDHFIGWKFEGSTYDPGATFQSAKPCFFTTYTEALNYLTEDYNKEI